MNAHAKVAQEFGEVDPTDKKSIAAFYKDVVPTMEPERQQDVFEALIHFSASSTQSKSLESLSVPVTQALSFDDPNEEAPLRKGRLSKVRSLF